MEFTKTRYGDRYYCSEDGCTVICWDSKTSTPADQKTRDARHELFDPLWRGKRFKNRNSAYKWLAKVMGLKREETHFGMFNYEQCQEAKRKIINAKSHND